MEGNYPILLGGKEAGYARIKKEGLYWKIFCCCKLSGDVLYRVVVKTSNNQESLGILVPDNGCFVLSARISMKRLAPGEPRFLALPKHTKIAERFVSVYPDEPFAYLDRIKKSRFGLQNQKRGVYIPE